MKIYEIKQGTEAWQDLRRGKLTGTTSKNVVGYKEMLKADLVKAASDLGCIFDEKKVKVDELKDMIIEENPNFSFKLLEEKINKDFEYKMLAVELVGDEDAKAEEDENPLQRGHDLEPVARKIFEKAKGKQVDEVGFVSLDEEPRIGLSPDGLIKNGGAYTEGLEIKSPCAWKYLKYWLENEIPDEYKGQCIDYFVQDLAIERVYLMIYNPKVEIHPYHFYVLERKDYEKDIEILKEAQIKFWQNHDARIMKIKQLAANLTEKYEQ